MWSEPFKSFANILSLSQLDFANVLPMGCVFSYDLYKQVLTSTLVPIGLFLILRYSPMYGKWLSASECIYLLQLLAFIVLPSTSLVLFKLFDCIEFPDGKAFATSDLTIECYTSTYTAYLVYSSFMILIYPIGIPMAFFALLYPKRELIAERRWKEPLSVRLHKYRFLLEDYKPSHWHGEVVRSLMRVLLSGGVILFSSNTSTRAAFGSLFGLLFVYGQREYAPFALPFNNAIALGSQHQIFFTYVMAFVVVANPNGISHESLGVVLLLANLAIFVMALQQQFKEAERKTRLNALRAKVEDFSKSVTGIVAVRRATKVQDVTRFVFGDWAAMSQAQRQKAAAAKQLDTSGVENEDELSRFLAVVQAATNKGEVAKWYWREDDHRTSSHDPASIHLTCWVAYADSVAAQLEFFYDNKTVASTTNAAAATNVLLHSIVDVDIDSRVTSIVDVDIDGRVTSSNTRGKTFAADSGTRYSVDLERMVQINAKTGYERKVLRVAEVTGKKKTQDAVTVAPSLLISGTALADDNDVDGPADDSEPPPFPSELAQAAEPLLLMQVGQLLQIQKQRDDGWTYGLVIFDPKKNKKVAAAESIEISTGGGIELAHKPQQAIGGSARISSIDRDVNKPTSDKSVHDQDGDEDNGESGGSVTAGWFPTHFTASPGVEEMSAMHVIHCRSIYK